MMRSVFPRLVGFCFLFVLAKAAWPLVAAEGQAADRGAIKGHVRLSGKLPGNPIIRMRRDPMCAKITAGKQVVQETVVANLSGDLANVFVKLLGTLPSPPVPTTPVIIDQRGCVYAPRVVGVRAGQPLEILNSDELLHNVHSSSALKDNSFNVAQPIKGMRYQVRLKEDESMVRVACDLHSWMNAYVGVVSHPYFAVSNGSGTFEIANVPAGTYTIQSWHERYGLSTQSIRVRPGTATAVDFTYVENGAASVPAPKR